MRWSWTAVPQGMKGRVAAVLSAGREEESPHPTTDKPGRRWVSGAVRTLWSRRLTKPGASGSSLGKLILPERPHPNNWGSITYPTAGCEQQTPAGSPTSQALRADFRPSKVSSPAPSHPEGRQTSSSDYFPLSQPSKYYDTAWNTHTLLAKRNIKMTCY